MELLHLRYFVAVAEELNFAAAAKKLHMAASPLSQRIKDLEHDLGHRLFDRSTRQVTLTPAGAVLLPLARDLLARAGSLSWRLDQAMRPGRSTMFVGMPAGIHPTLRERVNQLTERMADRIELRRWPGSSSDLVAGVREGKLAVTLARLPVADAELEQLPVMTERLGAVVPADQFAGNDSVSLTELAGFSYVSLSSEFFPAYFEQLDHQLNELGIKKRIRLTNTGYGGLAEVVSSGQAFSISMLGEDSPMHGYQLENVTVLPFTDFRPQLETGLLWRRDRADGGDLTELVTAAREIFAEPLFD